MVSKAAAGQMSLRVASQATTLLMFGCFAFTVGGTPAHAAVRRIVRPERHPMVHTIVHRPVHPAVHHVAYRHPADPHPEFRRVVHPVWHKPIWHKPVWHPVVWHKPVWHKPVSHKPVWHKPFRYPVVRFVRVHGRLERVEHIVHPVALRPAWEHPVQATRMSCVPFARADSGIDLAGDAYAWWNHAAGVYARGDTPVPGSVLTFRANVRMRLGHVAVVARVVNRREIEVDQSNWGDGGRITRDVPVIDVSEDNDWTEVRVALGDGRFGSVYPTYGFIYDRPDTGRMLARRTPAPELAANPAPSDLRALHTEGSYRRDAQVAELPGPLPAPPHWPARLGHRLHTTFVHHDVRHVTYRHPEPSRWTPHHTPVHHIVVRHPAPAHRVAAAR